jgi:poly(3-hydroxybutyrate) depolymerase
LGAALLIISVAVAVNAAEPREEGGFGSNPGNLRMFTYIPADLAPQAPLIVVLHGCKHKAVSFARDAGCWESSNWKPTVERVARGTIC